MSSLLLLAAIAKKRLDDERRASASRARRKKQLENDEKARRRSGYAAETFSHEHSYLDCVLKEMVQEILKKQEGTVKNDDKITLIRFCEEFTKTYEEISLEDAAPLLEKSKKIQEEIDKEKAKQLDLKKNLGDKFGTIISLGLRIDMLEEEEIPSRFRTEYSLLIENGKEDILLKEIKKLEQKIKYLPFRKKENELLLTEKKEKLEQIQKAKLKAEEFESLSTQDKKEILEYLQSKQKDFSLSQDLKHTEYEIIYSNECRNENGYGYDYKKLKDRRERTLGRMLSEKKISDKDLDDIYRKLDKVGIKARRGEYDFKTWSTATDGEVKIYKEFLKWFIEDVYEENEQFLERNTEIEEGHEHGDFH